MTEAIKDECEILCEKIDISAKDFDILIQKLKDHRKKQREKEEILVRHDNSSNS